MQYDSEGCKRVRSTTQLSLSRKRCHNSERRVFIEEVHLKHFGDVSRKLRRYIRQDRNHVFKLCIQSALLGDLGPQDLEKKFCMAFLNKDLPHWTFSHFMRRDFFQRVNKRVVFWPRLETTERLDIDRHGVFIVY